VPALASALVLALLAAVARGQSIDATLDDALSEQVDRQIEQAVADTVEQQVDSTVTQTVEQQVESTVTQTVEQQVESGVTDTIRQQVESGVTATVEDQLEAGLTESVTDALEASVEQALEGTVETLDPVLPSELESGLRDVTQQIGDVVEPLAPEGASEGAGSGQAAAGGQAAAERFAADLDEAGRTIERDVWVILVPAEHVARIQGWGFAIREQESLDALDRVLLRVDAPEDRDIAQAALELALDAPGTLVDFNHVYRGGADVPAAVPQAALPVQEPAPLAVAGPAIGVVDSAIAIEHGALAGAHIVQKDFVAFANSRPTQHGTAVASILVGQAGQLPRGARLYAASVFFKDEAGDAAATTASLVAGLAWLAAEGVRVVNMSLSGPPNRVLEAAIAQTVSGGRVVVAAVGNNGPVGEPLYPAAYDTVVGVTAVDSHRRIYRYANRGSQVAFAARGVRVKVARSGGGYGTETGTSMAAPYVAAAIARSIGVAAPAVVLETLKAHAVDLGDPGFDEVFGHGLIAGHD
jgi:subtilisin family serine protease